jgi:hypothetical protein
MAERNNKGDIEAKGNADRKVDIKADADLEGTIDQLRQGLDDLRGSVVSLTARVGEGALAAGGRGLQQARQVAGEVVEDVAGRANEGVATLRGRIEDQPLAAVALAFFAGMVLAGLVMASLITIGPGDQPQQRPGGAERNRGGKRRRDHSRPA